MELIVLATRNAGKVVELSRLLTGVARRFESLRDYSAIALPEEGEASYGENARGKARAVNHALGLPALGDDSGLEVDALDGAPGIRSARYAGALAGDVLNNMRLLEALRGVSPERRTARFRCVLALVRGPADERTVEGICEGRIVDKPRGEGGFGYDPIFEPAGASLTFAEMPGPMKDTLSHRALAAIALRASLAAVPR